MAEKINEEAKAPSIMDAAMDVQELNDDELDSVAGGDGTYRVYTRDRFNYFISAHCNKCNRYFSFNIRARDIDGIRIYGSQYIIAGTGYASGYPEKFIPCPVCGEPLELEN